MWLPPPFWGNLQGCLLFSASCGTGQTLYVRCGKQGPVVLLIGAAVKTGSGKAMMSSCSRKQPAEPWGLSSEDWLLLMEQGPHLCCSSQAKATHITPDADDVASWTQHTPCPSTQPACSQG